MRLIDAVELKRKILFERDKIPFNKVDKEELVKALRYDREQYEKGFRDGVASVRRCGKWLGERGDYYCSICGAEAPNDGYKPAQYCCVCGSVMENEMDGERKSE